MTNTDAMIMLYIKTRAGEKNAAVANSEGNYDRKIASV